MKTTIIPLIILALLPVTMLSQEISEWREEHRTGVSAETGLLKSWPANGPELLWSNQELPKGYSSPSFMKNILFITGTKGADDLLVAMDLNGKILWQKVMGRAWTQSFPDSRATPTVDGNKVYTCSGFGDLACFDGTTGAITWTYKASEMNQGTYGAWGIAESLLIDGDKVYYSPGGPQTMTIALDKLSGKIIWKSASLDDKPGYVSPILINYAGKKMIINVSMHHVFSVDASNGEILWKVKSEQSSDPNLRQWDPIKCTTPLFKDGMVYTTGGYDTGGTMIKIGEDGKSTNVIWTDLTLDDHHGGVVLVNGFIFGSNWINNSMGNWCCIDWKTGKKMWEERWNCKGSVIAAEGMLYLYEEKGGNVGLVRANPEKFDLVSSFKVSQGSPGPYWTHPVIHNGILYIRHNNALMAYDIKEK